MIKNSIFAWIAATIFMGFCTTASAQSVDSPDAQCDENTIDDTDFSYCVYPATDKNNHDLIVHFHGLGGNALSWKEHERHINTRRELAILGKSTPTVVSLSFGQLWLLTEVKDRGDKYNLVKNKILPFLEDKAGYKKDGPTSGRLILMGESMGGFNALQFYLKDPQIFSRYIIMCPAMGILNPWASGEEIGNFIDRTGASSFRVAFYFEVAKYNFRTPEEWASHNPFDLVKNQALNFSPIYLSGDEHDQYGFYEGDKIFNGLLDNKPKEHVWSSVDGTHCQIDSKSVAQFL